MVLQEEVNCLQSGKFASLYPFPVVLGHEGAGIVEGVGPGVTNVKVGDNVVAL